MDLVPVGRRREGSSRRERVAASSSSAGCSARRPGVPRQHDDRAPSSLTTSRASKGLSSEDPLEVRSARKAGEAIDGLVSLVNELLEEVVQHGLGEVVQDLRAPPVRGGVAATPVLLVPRDLALRGGEEKRPGRRPRPPRRRAPVRPRRGPVRRSRPRAGRPRSGRDRAGLGGPTRCSPTVGREACVDLRGAFGLRIRSSILAGRRASAGRARADSIGPSDVGHRGRATVNETGRARGVSS